MAQKAEPGNDEFDGGYKRILSRGRQDIRKGIPALPFCHIRLKAPKPRPASYPKEIKTLGDHLRKKRLDQGLLQRDIARQLGVSIDTVRLWERNRNSPKIGYIPKIIEFLGYLPEMTDQTPGKKLRIYRKARGLNQKEFA